jgi:hypothetical protein
MRRTGGAILLLLILGIGASSVLFAAGSEQNAQPTQSQTQPRGLVWRVEGQRNLVYIAGSMHLLPERAYPLPPAYTHAYEDSALLVLEADPQALQGATAIRAMQAAARYGQGTLADHIDADLLDRTRALVVDTNLSMASLLDYRPWFVAMAIEIASYRASGFRADLGLDGYFYARATGDGKPALPLQDVAAHLAIFTAMPDALSRDQLAVVVDHADELASAPAEVYAFWRSGDAAGLAASVAEQANAYPALFDRLLYDRNKAWLNTLEALLNSRDNAMVLVGSAHLVGPHGLIADLESQGLEITRLP